MRLAEERRRRDTAALLDRRQDGARPRLLESASSSAGAPTGTGTGSGAARGFATTASGTSVAERAPDGRRAVPCSSRSRRNAIDSRERSAAGRVTLTSASSSGRRGSPPWRMSSTATASRSIEPQDRRLAELVRLRAQPLARLLGRRGSASGTSPSCWTSISWRRCSIRSRTSRPRSCPRSESSSTYVSAPAVSRSITRSQSRKSASSSTVPSSSSTACTVTLFAGRGRELVERRDGVAVRAAAAARDERERLVGRVDRLGVGDLAQHLDEVLQARPLEDERLAARAHGRQHLREVGRAEDEDEVRRRLLDQLQERVPGGVGELVRLVEDVDLVAPLDRLEDDAVADLADVVDAALRRGVHLDHVERRARGDRAAGVAGAVGRRRRPLRAVEALGEDARHRRLAGAARPREEVGLAHRVGPDRVAQRPDDRLLPDHLGEALRTVLPVERGHVAIQAERRAALCVRRRARPARARPTPVCRQQASGEAARTERAESGAEGRAGEAGKRPGTPHTWE